MLQNPSKYHANPLSHFLALHSSQVVHNGMHSQTLSSVAGLGQNQYHHQQHLRHNTNTLNSHNTMYQQHQQIQNQHHHHQHHHQEQQAQQQQQTNQSHHQQQQHQHHQQQRSQLQQNISNLRTHTPISDDGNTSLDAGKSFTIAAILGLQKNVMEGNRKDYNSVINLSMNNNNNNSDNNMCYTETSIKHSNNSSSSTNSNSNNLNTTNANNNSGLNPNDKLSGSKGFSLNVVNSFNCDSSASLLNRFLPTANVSGTANPATSSSAVSSGGVYGASMIAHQQSTFRANSFAVAVAAAAAANASSGNVDGPSALQSLQQLHQHHAQQASLNFQREKLKTENKKSSLKNKRVRTIFTPEQLERLEAEFERQQYMVGPERLYLAHTLQLTEAQVKVWFQNRRIKWRKHHLEITQQRLALLRQTQLPRTNAIAEENTLTSTRASSVSCEDITDIKQHEHGHIEDSQLDSESDLSICNESMDGDSAIDGGEDT